MSLALFIDHVVIAGFLGLLLVAAISDFRAYLIPNRVVGAILLLYPAHVLASPTPVEWQVGLIIAAITFVAGFVLFLFKGMGGGDVKLLTAASMWAGAADFMAFTIITLIAALVLATTMAARMAAQDARTAGGFSIGSFIGSMRFSPILHMTVPYGVAIATGGMYAGARLFVG
ncbi:MAG: prepilin peptidase [Candidatus Eiseniibacteriota bacterium]